jgi:hypothetical protein
MKKYLNKIISTNFYLSKLYTIYKYFFFIRGNLKSKLNDKNIKFEKQNKKIIIFTLIETSHPVNFLLMLIAKILQIRGYKILTLICDSFLDGCEIKSIKNSRDPNPCFNCKFNQSKIFQHFKIPTIKLSEFNSSEINLLVQKGLKKFQNNNYKFKDKNKYNYLNTHIKDSVTRYFYGNLYEEKYKIKVKEISLKHCKTALYIHEICRKIDKKFKPKAVVSSMSVYSSWYPIFHYFKNNGNRFKQFSLTQFNLSAFFFNEYQLYPSLKRYKKFLKSRKNKNLTKNENLILSKFLNKRFKGSSKIFINDEYFNKKYKTLKEIGNLLKIDKKKKNIFLFTNVFWDVAVADRGLVFNSVLDWLFYTIDLLKDNENFHIYIKPHPSEFTSSESLIGIEEIIKLRFKEKISNLTFVKSEFKIKPYDLKPFIDLAVVFNGTLNIEFMHQKIPVISCGLSPTYGMKLTQEITTVFKYKKILIAKNFDYSKFIVKNNEKLKTFSYFYFIKNSIPWPYTSKVWGENFKGYNFYSLEKLNYKKNILHHFSKCISKEGKFVPENW